MSSKFINLIKSFFQNFDCNIILENNISDSFEASEFYQLKLLLFMVIVWILRNTTFARNGIQWAMFKQLEYLDFLMM